MGVYQSDIFHYDEGHIAISHHINLRNMASLHGDPDQLLTDWLSTPGIRRALKVLGVPMDADLIPTPNQLKGPFVETLTALLFKVYVEGYNLIEYFDNCAEGYAQDTDEASRLMYTTYKQLAYALSEIPDNVIQLRDRLPNLKE